MAQNNFIEPAPASPGKDSTQFEKNQGKSKCNFYEDVRNEDLEFLIENTGSNNWATRVHSFDKISEWFNEANYRSNSEINLSEFLTKGLIQAHLDHIDDTIVKVQESCFKSLNCIFCLFKDNFKLELNKLITKTVVHMVDSKDSVSTLSMRLFENILKSYNNKEVADTLVKFYHNLPSSKSQIKCLELIKLIFERKLDESDFTPSLIKSVFPKLSYIFGQKVSEKKHCPLIIAIFKRLFECNYESSYDSFNLMSPNLQNNLTEWANKYDQRFIDILNGDDINNLRDEEYALRGSSNQNNNNGKVSDLMKKKKDGIVGGNYHNLPQGNRPGLTNNPKVNNPRTNPYGTRDPDPDSQEEIYGNEDFEDLESSVEEDGSSGAGGEQDSSGDEEDQQVGRREHRRGGGEQEGIEESYVYGGGRKEGNNIQPLRIGKRTGTRSPGNQRSTSQNDNRKDHDTGQKSPL